MREYPVDPTFERIAQPQTVPGLRDEAVREAIDQLPMYLRVVVEGILWEQVPQRELARRLGVSKDEIRKRYHVALDQLSQSEAVQEAHRVGQVSAASEGEVV